MIRCGVSVRTKQCGTHAKGDPGSGGGGVILCAANGVPTRPVFFRENLTDSSADAERRQFVLFPCCAPSPAVQV